MREWVGWRESRRAVEERPQRLWPRGGGGLSSGRLLVSGARRLLNKVRSLAPGKAPVGRSSGGGGQDAAAPGAAPTRARTQVGSPVHRPLCPSY